MQRDILNETMQSLLSNKEFRSAPHFSAEISSIINKRLNGKVSFKKIKGKNLQKVTKYVNYLETMLEASKDKLEMAVRIAITGNTIDLGANPDFNLEKDINTLTSNKIDTGQIDEFRRDVDKAKKILIIGDNYEESVFDKFLIKVLASKDITYAVRSAEVLNDVTLEDARNLGIDKLCRVIESGSMIPGTDLESGTEEFLEIYKNADMVISKGQGNYETLFDEKRKIYFLFKVKCDVISKLSGYPSGTGILFSNKDHKEKKV